MLYIHTKYYYPTIYRYSSGNRSLKLRLENKFFSLKIPVFNGFSTHSESILRSFYTNHILIDIYRRDKSIDIQYNPLITKSSRKKFTSRISPSRCPTHRRFFWSGRHRASKCRSRTRRRRSARACSKLR